MSGHSIGTVEAELAASSVMHELASYRLRRKSESRRRIGRMSLLRTGSGSLPLEYSAIVTTISIAEGFFAATLQTRVEDAFDTTTQLMLDAQRDASRTMDSNWDDRLKRARRWFGIDSTSEQSVIEMLAFVEARNSIVHGVGRLTRRQMSDGGAKVTTQLTSVGVPVVGGALRLDEVAANRCARQCAEAIRWLDVSNLLAAAIPAGNG